MGYYINPPDMSKEQFLKEKGTPITLRDVRSFDYAGDRLPVCLVDNGWMTAAAIAYHPREAEAFLGNSGGLDARPKTWYSVSCADLEPYYKAKTEA
jgi:hypothetical protein